MATTTTTRRTTSTPANASSKATPAQVAAAKAKVAASKAPKAKVAEAQAQPPALGQPVQAKAPAQRYAKGPVPSHYVLGPEPGRYRAALSASAWALLTKCVGKGGVGALADYCTAISAAVASGQPMYSAAQTYRYWVARHVVSPAPGAQPVGLSGNAVSALAPAEGAAKATGTK